MLLYSSLKKIAASAVLGLVFLCAGAHAASAATLSMTPQTGTAAVGTTINVLLSAASDVTAVHVLSGTLSFPTNLLEVVSISKSQSMISSWVTDPTFLNTAGTIQFNGMVPNPGFIGTDGRVLMVTFKVKAVGTADLSYSAGSIIANDGDGTEILTSKTGATYTLTKAVATVSDPSATTDATTTAKPPDANLPQVSSVTHPDATWSHLMTGTFSFVVPSTITALRLLVDDKPTTIPTITYVPPITSRDIKDLPEGISYLHVQYKTAAGWGLTLHYKLQIDTTAPTTFTISEMTPGKFTFVSNDALSGIARYDIQIDGGAVIAFTDDGSHIFTAPEQTSGSHTLLVRAVDAAGNTTDSTLTFTSAVPVALAPVPVVTPSVVPVPDSVLLSKGMFAVKILSVVTPLVALALLLAWLLYLAWRTLGGITRKIDAEIAEARSTVHQSFTEMNAQFEQDIALLRKTSMKRKLTREESKILKHLQTTLDAAESEITKEISAIEKINQ